MSSQKDGDALIKNTLRQYAESLRRQMISVNALNNSGQYNPMLAQEYLHENNSRTRVPTQEELTRWLRQPHNFMYQLRDTERFLDSTIMQYNRSKKHFSSSMIYNNDLTALDMPDVSNKEEINAFYNGRKRCLKFFSKLNHRFHFDKISQQLMSEGAVFVYLRETEHLIDLTPLPVDYCWITGTWDMGFTFALDLVWLDKVVGIREQIPEFYDAYKIFVKMRELGFRGSELAPYQYFPIPVEKGWVFTFDPVHAVALPPLKGAFKDALEIVTYKNLLKQRTTLDTWKVIAQKIPYDQTTGSFIVDYQEASEIVSVIQSLMPNGVKTYASFFDQQDFSFTQAQNMNNITGLGEQLYWGSLGIAGNLYGMDNKTGAGLRLSLEADAGYIDHLYMQYENFVNFHFLVKSRNFRFKINIYGNRYTESDDLKNYSSLVASNNLPVGRLLGKARYDAHEVDATLFMENDLRWKQDYLPPIVSAFNTADGGEGGRPESDSSQLTDSGQLTRDMGSNDNK